MGDFISILLHLRAECMKRSSQDSLLICSAGNVGKIGVQSVYFTAKIFALLII